MPNRYEREIEEILRNLEQTDAKPTAGRGRPERKTNYPPPMRRRTMPSISLRLPEWVLVIAIITALFAGGIGYTQGPNLVSGILVVISLLCFIWVALSRLIRPRYPAVQGRYSTITPLRRDPWSAFKTRWNLFWLKFRYRRRRG